jgi:hypothetical protein
MAVTIEIPMKQEQGIVFFIMNILKKDEKKKKKNEKPEVITGKIQLYSFIRTTHTNRIDRKNDFSRTI